MTLKHLLTRLLLLLLLSLAQPCFAAGKLALVIGNSTYAEAPLLNPVNDARDMAKALRGLGFEVIIRENQSQEGMNEAAREFGDRLGEGMVGLFYYAGHGMQVKGKNYLIPVQSGIKREDEVPFRAFDVNQLLAKMESAHNGLNLVVLDACRNNPFERSFRSGEEGLAPMDAPTGTLIAYAAKPGTKSKDSDASGNNGLYTGTLLKYINTMPYLKIEELLKKVRLDVKKASGEQQATWEEGGLENDFCFSGCGLSPNLPPALAPIPVPALDNTRIELEFWNSVKDSDNPADFQAYLQQYPSGKFAALAKNRLTPVTPAPTTPSTPQTLPTVSDEWKSIDRYQVKEGLVKDTKTGLMWLRCSLGQTWDGVSCQGEAKRYAWDDAIKTPEGFNYSGYSDWRLPAINELKTLVYCSSGKPKLWNDTGNDCDGDFARPTINSLAFPQTNSTFYWSSSPAYFSGYGWYVAFINGFVNWNPRGNSGYVRLVRSGQ